jgi:hypothetical protein
MSLAWLCVFQVIREAKILGNGVRIVYFNLSSRADELHQPDQDDAICRVTQKLTEGPEASAALDAPELT